MKAFGHDFQRLPSEHELDFYRANQPSTSYEGATGSNFHISPNLNVPQFQYQHVDNHGNRPGSPVWTNSPTFKILGFVSHLVLTLMPVAFILLAFLALSVDGDPQSQRGKTVYQAAKLGPSIFPIVFAAVVGRLMRTFALWRAERGSTIGLLEQLNGSQNLLAAVERSFLLSSLWGWGLVIIVLWALSPLGGQSSLRVLDLTQTGSQFNSPVKYYNTDNYNDTIFAGASSLAYGLAATQAIFQACLLAPASISSSSEDIWGNVKVPLMQAQSGYTGASSQDWIDVLHNNDTVYSSLTGIVVSGLRSDTNANFTVESSYFNLTCPEPKFFGTGDPNANSTPIFDDFETWLGDVAIHTNKSRLAFQRTNGDELDWNSFTVDSNFNFSASGGNNKRPMNIIFASRNVNIVQITAYNCTLGFTHAESSVACNGTTCRVEKMRPSRSNTDSSVSTPFNQDGSFVPFLNFMSTFPWLSGTVHSAETTPSDFYINGNNTPFQPPGLTNTDYSKVSGLQVAQRLGALLNTAWQSSIAQTSIASPPPELSALNDSAISGQPFGSRSTTSIMQTNQTVYRASKLWIGFTAAISLILFACGVAGMTFRYLATAPDILGYVSTMTRDNPFFNDHRIERADTLDGLERARLLRDAVVQISDVGHASGRSHLALKSITVGETRRKSRLRNSRRGSPAPSSTTSARRI